MCLNAQTFPTTKIKNAGSDDQRINFVVLAEGYTSAQTAKFATDAAKVRDVTFTEPPLSNYSNFFNLHTIAVVSLEAGAKHPGIGSDSLEPRSPISIANNYFNTTFDYNGGVHRLIYTSNFGQLSTVAASNYPGYDQLILLVNDPEYGGAGGAFACLSSHPSSGLVAVHEIGHSFANLADEYAYNSVRYPRANLSTQSNPALSPWSPWIGTFGIGIYPIETFAGTTYYRPHQNCMMRSLSYDFCAICSQRIIDRIYELVDPIDSYLPASASQSYSGTPLNFSVTTINPIPNTLTVSWWLDGNQVATGSSSFTFGATHSTGGAQVLTARVTDATSLSKSYAPAAGYVFEQSWSINNAPLTVEWIDFRTRDEPAINRLNWSTASETNAEYYQVERRIEGDSNFQAIGKVEARGESQEINRYTFADLDPRPGLSYYRLRQVDRDGEVDFSKIVAQSRVTRWFYKLFPNPSPGVSQLEIYSDHNAKLDVEVFNTLGSQVLRKHYELTAGRQNLNLDLSDLTAGIYQVRLVRDGGVWEETVTLERM